MMSNEKSNNQNTGGKKITAPIDIAKRPQSQSQPIPRRKNAFFLPNEQHIPKTKSAPLPTEYQRTRPVDSESSSDSDLEPLTHSAELTNTDLPFAFEDSGDTNTTPTENRNSAALFSNNRKTPEILWLHEEKNRHSNFNG